MARGYISILSPNTGNPSPVVSRTRITQSGGLANSPAKSGKNFDNPSKKSVPSKTYGSGSYEGLDANISLARK